MNNVYVSQTTLHSAHLKGIANHLGESSDGDIFSFSLNLQLKHFSIMIDIMYHSFHLTNTMTTLGYYFG
jgi:hypothetical protein